MNRSFLPVIVSIAITWPIAWLVYSPGLSGAFLFDDFPNLAGLGAFGPIETCELAWAYISSGFSGPTGRPLSLTTFLLDGREWPTLALPFKRTNVILHLLVGVVLFSTLRTLIRSIGRECQASDWIALLATGLWLVNPFLVSTTLYVVQRMAQLSTLFVLLGILGYLHGRTKLAVKPFLGYTQMTSAIIIGTVLAVYSKENGALLPLLILVIELALWHHWLTPRPDWRWMAIFLWGPTFVILYYLIDRIPSNGIYANRDFSLAERLWTQPRFIWDYLWHLLVPHIQTQGLYQDGRIVSISWWTPWTTTPALIGVLGLGLAGWLARRRWPLVSLALLFFLAGHLLESTTLGLELYFEHRNYLPAAFLFLPIAAGIWALRGRVKPAIIALIAIALIGSNAFATWQRATLWGDHNQLMLVWANTNPHSPRAQVTAAQAWLRLQRPDRAFAVLEQAMENLSESTLLTASYLAFKADQGKLSSAELQQGLDRMLEQAFDAQALRALEHLVDTFNAQAPMPQHSEVLLDALGRLRESLGGRVSVAHRFSYYLQGKLLAGQGDGEKAYKHFYQALTYYRSTESALNMVSVLATYKYYQLALEMLEQAEATLEKEPDANLKRRRSTYEMEIKRLRANLLEDIDQAYIPRYPNDDFPI